MSYFSNIENRCPVHGLGCGPTSNCGPCKTKTIASRRGQSIQHPIPEESKPPYLYLRQEPRLGYYGDDAGSQQVKGSGAFVVKPGRDPDEIIVTRADGTSYHVRRKVRVQVLTRPGRLRTGFCWGDERVFGRATWCEGTQGTIDAGANLPGAARRLLDTLVDQINRRETPEEIARTLENAQVQTFVELSIAKDRKWGFTG